MATTSREKVRKVSDKDDADNRINFRVDPDLKKRAESAAQADGISLSAWIKQAMSEKLRRRE